jgi:Flp pilus assembly protein TadG
VRINQGGRNGQRGFAMMYSAIVLTVLTVFCGLAVDATVLFLVNAKLSSAVDAAALAGARSVDLQNTFSAAKTQATTAAQNFFLANFPNGYLGSQPINMATNFSASFTQSATTGLLTVSINASVQAPVYFMRILGFQNITVSSAGSATRRALVVMLMLDVSGSMADTYQGESACDYMKTAATDFVGNFSAYDYIGMVTFDSTAHLKYAPTTDWGETAYGGASSLTNAISGLTCQDSTNTTAALNLAYSEIKSVGLPLAVNTIMLFTDGMPNAISASNWPVRNFVDARYGWCDNGSPPGGQGGNCSDSVKVDSTVCPNDGKHYGKGYCGDSNGYCTSNSTLCAMKTCTTSSTSTLTGAISQSPNYKTAGDTNGLAKDFDTDPSPSGIPSGCSQSATSNNPLRQVLAYIPSTDRFGNTVTQPVGQVFKDNWVFPVNNECNPTGTCADLGGLWSTYFPSGTPNSNFFPASDPATGTSNNASGQWRLDQPTTIGAAGMNAAVSQANTIRSDTTYNISINSIFLLGDGTDPVDKYFLPVISNQQNIPALPVYEPTGTSAVSNPYYNSAQKVGQFDAADNPAELEQLFEQIASSLLRLNQ